MHCGAEKRAPAGGICSVRINAFSSRRKDGREGKEPK